MSKQRASPTWEVLRESAMMVMLNYLRSADPHDLPHVKLAATALSNYTRHEATESAKLTTGVLVARELSANKEEFAKYLKLSAPTLQLPELASPPS